LTAKEEGLSSDVAKGLPAVQQYYPLGLRCESPPASAN